MGSEQVAHNRNPKVKWLKM